MIKSALQFKDRMIVQPACDHAFIFEHELAGEKLRLRKFFGDEVTFLCRFIRDVGAPAREAMSRYPVPARKEAIERLNRGLGRGIIRSLFPGR